MKVDTVGITENQDFMMSNNDVSFVKGGLVAIYNPSESVRLDVRVNNDTVWLTQNQMGILFGVDRTVIVRHIGNIYKSGELSEESTCANIAQVQNEGGRSVRRIQKYYDLDVILSVGFRVNSSKAIYFRRWASKILKDYLLGGHLISSRMDTLEKRVSQVEEKMDLFVNASLPPMEGIFYDGQIFDAYLFVSKLIKGAAKEIVLIDNYIDETVLTLLDKRESKVSATIYTKAIDRQLRLDLQRHNEQYSPIEIRLFGKAHDRFLIIDDSVYHIGASLKDLGKKWFAFSLMRDLDPQELIQKISADPQ